MKTILLLFFIVVSYSSYGIIIGPVKIEGTVVKYDKKTVTLKNDKGKKIKVSRRAIPKQFKLRSGAKVHALLNPKVITNQLKKQK